MKELQAYVPIDRLLALAGKLDIPEHMNGTVLFADISGFTPLMESYVLDLGRQRGTEEFSMLLNRFFDAMITPLHNYQGSVICFIGDALVCWFRDDDGIRALSACFRINEVILPFAEMSSPTGRAVSLKLKMCVVHGPVRRFVVGDPQIQLMDSIAGPTVDWISEAELLVRPGEIMIQQSIAGQYKEILETSDVRPTPSSGDFVVCNSIREIGDADPWPVVPSLPLELLKPWIVAPLFDKVTSGERDFIIELRISVVCFLKFSIPSASDGAFDTEVHHAFFTQVQRIVTDHGGQVFQITFGDKGNNIFYGFGAPISHEDDINRALDTSLQLVSLRESLHYLQDLQIGISVGHFRTGPYGARSRGTYACLGAHANLAARLMTQARPGQVLVSQQIMEQAHNFEFSPLGTARIKGFTRPVPVFSIERKKLFTISRDHENFDFTGRENEKALLIEQVDAVRSGSAAKWCIIQGDAGIGKSNLVAWLSEKVPALGFRVLTSRSDAIDQRVPYHGLQAVLQQILGIEPMHYQAGQVNAGVHNYFKANAPALEQWAPLLQYILRQNWEDNETTAALSAAEKEPKLKWLIEQILLLEFAKGPVLLVLENSQWLNSSTAELLHSLFNLAPENLLTLIVGREFSKISSLAQIQNHPETLHMTIEVLSKDELSKLLTTYLACAQIDDRVLDAIFRKTSGHPLFSRTLIDAMLDNGILSIYGGICTQADPNVPLDLTQLPDSIHSLILNRIDRLTGQEQLALKVASILGESFTLPFLNAIYPVEQEEEGLAKIVQLLVKSRIIAPVPDKEELTFKFEHQVIHQVVYGLVPFELRKRIHLELVRWIESEHAANLTTFYPVLGHHSEAAEDYAVSARYWVKVGEQAIHHGVYKGAEEVVIHAQSLLEKLPGTQENLEQLLDLLLTHGSIRLATHGQSAESTGAVYLKARDIVAKITRDIPQKATVLFGLCVHYFMRGEIEKSYALATDVLSIGERLDLVQIQMQAHLMLANCSFWKGDFTTEDKHVTEVLKLYEKISGALQLTHYAQNPKITVLICHTWSLALRGKPEDALTQCKEVMALAASMNHSFSIGMAFQIVAFLSVFLKNTKDALGASDQLIAVAKAEGFPVFLKMGEAVQGWILARTEDPVRGIEIITDTIIRWRANKATLGLGMFYYMLADTYAHAQMWKEGLQMLQQADEHIESMEERVFHPGIFMCRGRFHKELGQHDDALIWLRRAYDLSMLWENYMFGIEAAGYLAEELMRIGENGTASELFFNIYNPDKTAVDQKAIDSLRTRLKSFTP